MPVKNVDSRQVPFEEVPHFSRHLCICLPREKHFPMYFPFSSSRSRPLVVGPVFSRVGTNFARQLGIRRFIKKEQIHAGRIFGINREIHFHPDIPWLPRENSDPVRFPPSQNHLIAGLTSPIQFLFQLLSFF